MSERIAVKEMWWIWWTNITFLNWKLIRLLDCNGSDVYVLSQVCLWQSILILVEIFIGIKRMHLSSCQELSTKGKKRLCSWLKCIFTNTECATLLRGFWKTNSIHQNCPSHVTFVCVCRLHAEESAVLKACLQTLSLRSLSKEPSVSSSQMIQCCSRLQEQQPPLMQGLHVCVSHFYSVLQDGELCIPWDWHSWGAQPDETIDMDASWLGRNGGSVHICRLLQTQKKAHIKHMITPPPPPQTVKNIRASSQMDFSCSAENE